MSAVAVEGPVKALYPIAHKILAQLLLHKVMTTTQLITLFSHEASDAWVRKQLVVLKNEGYAMAGTLKCEEGQGPARVNRPRVWFATALAKEHMEGSADLRGLRVPDPPSARAVAVGAQAHNLAVNTVGIRIALDAAAQRPGAESATWLNEVGHQVSAVVGKGRYSVSDGLILLSRERVPGRADSHRILFELDRGTKQLELLLQQQRNYLKLYNFKLGKSAVPLWHESFAPVPGMPAAGYPMVMWVFDGNTPEAQERRLLQFVEMVSSGRVAPDLSAAKLWLQVTTLDRFNALGPYNQATFLDVYQKVNVNLWGEADEPRLSWPASLARCVAADV